MELRDLIVTPIIILLVYAGAYAIRPYVTDPVNRKYFLPGLTVRVIGALALGFIYQFYYDGGDTFNFHTRGSRHVWEAFMENPIAGWRLLASQGDYAKGTYEYATKIAFYSDASSFFVVRLATLFDLITFSAYSGTAVLFALLAFTGSWLLFLTFYRQNPELHGWLAAATLFIPSVVFWGSGIMKDTLTLAAVDALTFAVYQLFLVKPKASIWHWLLLLLCVWTIFSVKKYILLCFAPALLLWIYTQHLHRIKSMIIKLFLMPVIGLLLVASGYYAILLIGEDDPRYSLDKIATTARITAYDIGFYSGRNAGSGYNLGELDGSFESMLAKTPQAINVSLFRPYLWEVKNPLMLFSSLEGLLLLAITLYVLVKKGRLLWKALGNPTVVFCLVFSLTFAFAVGVSTFNFGTLSRYKIPLLPFYGLAMVYLLHYRGKSMHNG